MMLLKILNYISDGPQVFSARVICNASQNNNAQNDLGFRLALF